MKEVSSRAAFAVGFAVLASGMAEVDGLGADREESQLMSVASTDQAPNRWAVLALLSVAQPPNSGTRAHAARTGSARPSSKGFNNIPASSTGMPMTGHIAA